MTIGIYDCVVDPNYKSAQGNLGVDNAFKIEWDKYFDVVKKHPSNLFLVIKTDSLAFLIHNNGNYTVTKAKDEEEVINFLDKIKDILKAEC